MNTSHVTVNKNLVLLAQVLQRLERSPAVDADQYRVVIQRLAVELEATPRDAGFDAVLANFPAVAELYENLHYAHAGLCRSSLDMSLAAEVAARAAIDGARRPA